MKKNKLQVIDEKRFCELEQTAINACLDKLDFNVTDYLDEKEAKEYLELYKKLEGECLSCGKLREDCKCK